MFLTVTVLQAQSLTSLQGQHVDTILKHHVEGEGVLISNGKFNNQTGIVTFPQIAYFTVSNPSFPIDTGILLTTGTYNMSGSLSNTYTETALAPYSGGYSLTNCASLEFDFIAMADTFAFNYIFASQEYCDFVNSQYNDVFAFLLTGGVDPVTYLPCNKNVAIVPGTITASNPNGVPVTINNVNHGYHSGGTGPGSNPSNSQYFICNGNHSLGVSYDGFTTKLSANAAIFGCNTYHMKLAVCNVSDQALDSGVFIEEGSFYSPRVAVEQDWESEQGGDTLIQNCRNLDLTFSIEHPFITAYTSVIIQTGGDAVLGVDYSLTTEEGMELTVDNNANRQKRQDMF